MITRNFPNDIAKIVRRLWWRYGKAVTLSQPAWRPCSPHTPVPIHEDDAITGHCIVPGGNDVATTREDHTVTGDKAIFTQENHEITREYGKITNKNAKVSTSMKR
uniref:Uncharacterized protein n=1 Tax=Candidatus Kentrum sp. LPFa TaxID=2126335 RepID=A0A450VXP5_9GAMM|nr:MAG: hypothetical protein BECKLPF1236B_GA0070989_101011 [Candidatus Kentron sp. LPFa]